MNTEKKFGALSSSVDPSKLALSVESFLKAISFIVIFLLTSKGVPVDAAQALYAQIIALVVQLVPAILTIWFTGQTLFALARKLLVKKIGV